MRSFFVISFFCLSLVSFANHFPPESAEFQAAVREGEAAATEETKSLETFISSTSLILNQLTDLIRKEVNASGSLGKKVIRDIERGEIFKRGRVASTSSQEASSSSDDSDKEKVIHQGWLYKKRLRSKRWPKRWVVVTDRRFIYYEGEEKSRRINQLKRKDFSVIKMKKEKEDEIVVKARSVRWFFKAESKEEKARWLRIFKTWKPDQALSRAERLEEEKLFELESITEESRKKTLQAKLEGFRVREETQRERLHELQQNIGRAKGALSNALSKMTGDEDNGNPF